MLFLIFLILYIFVGVCINRINQRNHKGCLFAPLCNKCDVNDSFMQANTICFWPIEVIILIIKNIYNDICRQINKHHI